LIHPVSPLPSGSGLESVVPIKKSPAPEKGAGLYGNQDRVVTRFSADYLSAYANVVRYPIWQIFVNSSGLTFSTLSLVWW
jgi:hypothetical protein